MTQIRDQAQPETGGSRNSVIAGLPVMAEPATQRLRDRAFWIAAAAMRARVASEGSSLIGCIRESARVLAVESLS